MHHPPPRAGDRKRHRQHSGAWLLLALLLFISPLPAHALRGQMNVNTATAEELQRLPFIGAAKAGAIIALRRHGPLRDLSELQKSPVIGPSTFEAIRPYLKLTGPHTLTDDTATSPPTAPADSNLTVTPLIVTRPGEVRLLTDDQYYPALCHLIRTARQRIDLAMFLFKITGSPANRPRLVMEELAAARKRGVQVQVLLEQSGYDEDLNRENKKSAAQLRRKGINVAFDGKETTSHTKVVVIDRHLCLLGSHNLTHSALATNHETSLLIDSRELAEQLISYMETLPR
ncbi:MAG: phospholipase D-like domain-containing protein [Desulfobulbaceae bacterium]|nr:phospholipase D-like domain-containing protein [Desulfobulbaceae bacterium]